MKVTITTSQIKVEVDFPAYASTCNGDIRNRAFEQVQELIEKTVEESNKLK